MDSNAGHLNNRPVHGMVLLLLPSGGNRNYTGWLADWLHWLLLTAAICNGCCYLQLLPSVMAAAVCNCCPLQWLLLSAMAAAVCNCCPLQWLLLSAMAAAVCNGCCCLKWLLLSAASGSSGYTGVVVEVLNLLLVIPVEICQTSNCSKSCGHGTNKCSVISM